MSPWDELKWFEPVKTALVTPASKGSAQLCAYNPRRAVLMFGNVGTGGAAVFPAGDPGGNNLNGIQLSGNYQTIILTQKDHGPLCQVDWWVSVPLATTSVYVIECILRDWPAGEVSSNANIADWLRSQYQRNGSPAPVGVPGQSSLDTDTIQYSAGDTQQ